MAFYTSLAFSDFVDFVVCAFWGYLLLGVFVSFGNFCFDGFLVVLLVLFLVDLVSAVLLLVCG